MRKAEGYFLRWNQGSYPFFFSPDYKVVNGSLWFAMQATSSSGNLSGRTIEIEIKGRSAAQAIETGGAYWWEPDRSTVALRIVKEE